MIYRPLRRDSDIVLGEFLMIVQRFYRLFGRKIHQKNEMSEIVQKSFKTRF